MPPEPLHAAGPAGSELQPGVRSGYAGLLVAAGSWFGAWGIQMVIFQWLVVDVLEEGSLRVGAAQMAVSLPSLIFLLLGGAAADRIDPRRMLIVVHLAGALSVAGLCGLVATQALSYPALLVFGATIGTLQAFGLPARDTQLSNVVRGPLSRAVTGTTLTQHGSQFTGALFAGAASWLGALPVLAVQTLVLLVGMAGISRLPRRAKPRAPRAPLALGDLAAGVLEVAHSPILRPVMILAISTGLFFVGPFLVILPLMVRDVYAGGAAEMGVLTSMFPLGSVLGGLAILARGGIERNGPALAAGQLFAVLCIGAIALDLSFPGAACAVLGWGIAGALFINSGRTLFQQHASETNRARVLSVYTLGIMGGGPIGSLLSGLLADPLGLQATLALAAGIAASILLAVLLTTRLWSLR